jgi:UDP-glucose 4-epimerase
MRALVTGGAGFIGHHIVGELLARGHEVTILDDFSSGTRARLASYLDRIVVVDGSVLEAGAVDSAVVGCDVVFHLAAIASVSRSVVAPGEVDAVNVRGTIEVMLASARHRVGRVILAGSAAVYGVPDTLPCSESQMPAPVSPYGVSKLAAEHYLHVLGRLHGIQTVARRYFNVFGPGQDPRSEYAAVVPAFVTAVLGGRRPTVNGSGEITRDFVFVDDVVEANLLAADSSHPGGLTCNIASGSRASLLDLLHAIGAAAGHPVDPIFGPPRVGDILESEADITLAQAALGYAVKVPFAEGIRRTVVAYRAEAGLAGDRNPGG